MVDKYMEENRRDKITGIKFGLKKSLSRKVDSSLAFLCEKQKFLPESEKVTRYSIESRIDYKFSRRISAGIGYTHNNRNSNINSNDFHNNVVWLQAKVTY